MNRLEKLEELIKIIDTLRRFLPYKKRLLHVKYNLYIKRADRLAKEIIDLDNKLQHEKQYEIKQIKRTIRKTR